MTEVDTMGRMLRMCLNWRVLVALGVLGVGIWIVAPNLIAGVLPLLAFAVCPLSMLLMMRGMGGMNARRESPEPTSVSNDERLLELKRELIEARAREERLAGDIRALQEHTTEKRDA